MPRSLSTLLIDRIWTVEIVSPSRMKSGNLRAGNGSWRSSWHLFSPGISLSWTEIYEGFAKDEKGGLFVPEMRDEKPINLFLRNAKCHETSCDRAKALSTSINTFGTGGSIYDIVNRVSCRVSSWRDRKTTFCLGDTNSSPFRETRLDVRNLLEFFHAFSV